MANIGIIVNCLTGGGAERCAADLSLFFEKKGYNVIFFTDLSVKSTYNYKGKLVNFTYKLTNTLNPLENKIEELRDLKDKYSIDIAISFMQFANYINIMSKGDEKIVLTTHSVNSEYAKQDRSVFWSEYTFRELYQYADVITFPSEYCRKDWLDHYGDQNNITRTIYNPVHVMQTGGKAKRENIVLAIGRLHVIKRQWHIIRVFKLIKEKCPNSRLIILGDGELRSQLEQLIMDFQLENDVEMPGNVTDVNDYLARAKVFTMTSYCEAMPCSVLEAMSAGVPVVACDIPGGLREELKVEACEGVDVFPIRSECGVIVPYIKPFYTDQFSKEEEMLADEIVALLNNDELWREMGNKAKLRAADFSLEKIGAVWVDSIINDGNSRRIDLDEFDKVKKRSMGAFSRGKENRNEMYVLYYRLLEKWMVLREHGKSTKTYFEVNGLKNIIIYGLGKMADHLIEDLKQSDINIVCAIDRGALNKRARFPVISDENDIPNADCIVITPVYDAESIRQSLENKTTIPILSLSDVVDGAELHR